MDDGSEIGVPFVIQWLFLRFTVPVIAVFPSVAKQDMLFEQSTVLL
jgi:hypothetical protein